MVNIGVNVAIRPIARKPLKTKGWVNVVHVVNVVTLRFYSLTTGQLTSCLRVYFVHIVYMWKSDKFTA